jgi:MerR family transcriptional regulator, redox-sensitive transcriptional activator SoxR
MSVFPFLEELHTPFFGMLADTHCTCLEDSVEFKVDLKSRGAVEKKKGKHMETLTIGEVARQAGVRTSTLRYYESVGLIPPPEREHKHRRYDPSIFSLLAILRMAQHAGFSLAEMQLLVHGFPPDIPASERWQQLARTKLQEVEALIVHAQQTKQILERLVRCECLRLEECIQGC